MRLIDYYSQVLVPANVAVSQLRVAGLHIDRQRLDAVDRAWDAELRALRAVVEAEAARCGVPLKYSDIYTINPDALARFLYSPRGLGLEVHGTTKKRQKPSTADVALQHYASVSVPRKGDH